MTQPASSSSRPRWQDVADDLEALVSGPTVEQLEVAKALSLDLDNSMPAQVAATVIAHNLSEVLLERRGDVVEIPDELGEIEYELKLKRTNRLFTGTRREVSAWFSARYALMTIRGLRALKPEIGDIVRSPGWRPGERREVSTIGNNGRVYMRKHPTRSAWPNNLEMITRLGSVDYDSVIQRVNADNLNSQISSSTNLEKFQSLDRYALESVRPTPEAVRALEDLLESGERLEEPLQSVLTRHPELLAGLVVGGWKTYVIPKQRLGADYVTDFLVLGINSLGPRWVSVELEAARHNIVNKDGTLSTQTRHAIKQIQDWGEWLTVNVAHAQMQLGLHGLTNRAPGLIIIGRDDPSIKRASSREESGITIHSWDWLLRTSKSLVGNQQHVSDFAAANQEREIRGRKGLPDIVNPISQIDADDEWIFDDDFEGL